MSANIKNYIGRQAAWHGLGTVTSKYMSIEELLADEAFQYSIFKSQLHDGLGRLVDAWGTFRWDHKDRLAGNKEAAVFLGAVGEGYTVIDDREGFKTIDALMRSKDGAFVETAGVLGKGEKVWILADLKFSMTVGGDKIYTYLLFSTSHDGSMAHSYRLVTIRVVCQNTLSAALSSKTSGSLSIRHTKNAVARLDKAREALDAMGEDVQRMEDRLNFLAGRRMNREALISVMDRLFPKQKAKDGGEGERDTTRRNNILADILKVYELNDGNAYPEQRGTAYNLLNAITGWVDHDRGSDADKRSENALFGSGDVLKTKAYEVLLETAKGLDAVPSRSVYFDGNGGSTGSGLLDGVLDATAAMS